MWKYGLVFLSLLLSLPQAYPQTRTQAQALTQISAAGAETMVENAPDWPRQQLEQKMIARAVAERQTQLRIDTEKLLALATELKQHVDKTGPNILSMEVIKKAQEIEKLAKSVKDKMRNAY